MAILTKLNTVNRKGPRGMGGGEWGGDDVRARSCA